MEKVQDIPLKKKLAVIGGGVSGVNAAKFAYENGFEPKIFEKRGEIGGIWSKTGYTWNSMICNSSKYMGQFSEHPFAKDFPLFPTRSDIVDYLNSYVEKFNLWKYVNLNVDVQQINFRKTADDEEIWTVEWIDMNTNEKKQEEFGNLIVATGFYNIPNIDYFSSFINDESNSKIKFIHSSEYKENSSFCNKEVLLVGCSYSSQQIAAEISQVSKTLINVFRRPSWVLSRTIYNACYQKPLPIDFSFFTLKTSQKKPNEPSLLPEEKNAKTNKLLCSFSKQNQTCPELFIDENSRETPLISVADGYLESIEKGLIKPIRSGIKDIKDNIVTLFNGQQIKPDIILLSTGFKHLVPNFDRKILEDLHFNKDDELCPFNLYNSTFNPKYKTLAFVGVYKGLFLGTAEIQAKYAMNYIIGKNSVSKEIIQTHLQDQLNARKLAVKPQYANGGYVNMLNSLAVEMGMMPNLDKIQKEDSEFHNLLLNSVACPVVYFLSDVDEKKRAEAHKMLKEMKNNLNL